MNVAIGVDSHKSSLSASAVDNVGRWIDVKDFINDERGHRALLVWARAHPGTRVIGIEGSGNYGAGVARYLLAHGEDVKEVPVMLSHRERKRTPSKGKSDAVDATAIARVVARGDGLAAVRPGLRESDLRLLCDRRDQLVRARTQAANRTHRLLAANYPGYGKRITKLTAKKNLAAVVTLVRGDHCVVAELLRDHVGDLRRLNDKITTIEKQLARAVAVTSTSLTDFKGIGDVTAARILANVGDPRALRSAAAFAMLNGTAPIEASSGATTRHRLNRGGDRKLNHALHMMATTLCRTDATTKAYVARRTAEGKTPKEAMRCLKRQLSNVVYRRLVQDALQRQNAA